MSQTYSHSMAATDTLKASRTTINDSLQALLTMHSGASAPGTTYAGMLWHDTTSNILKLRNQADSAWIDLFPVTTASNGGLLPLTGGTMSGAIAMGSSKITGLANGTASGDAVHQGQIASLQRVVSVKVDIESNTTDDEVPLAVMPACTVVEAYIASDTATSGSGATQRYGFNIKNRDVDGTGTNELAAADLKTDATELAAFDTAPIGLDQNLTVTAGQLLTLLIDVDNGGGNPTDLSSAEIVVTIVYTLTVT